METPSIFLVAALFFAGVFGAVLCRSVVIGLLERHRSQKAIGRTGGMGLFGRILGRGIGPFNGVARIALHNGLFSMLVGDLAEAAHERGYKTDPVSVCSLLLALLLSIGLLAYFLSFSLVGSLALVACALLGLNAWTARRKERRKTELREEIPEALQTMKACFQTGYSLPQTIHEVASGAKGPLADLFSEIEGSLEANRGVNRALSVLKGRDSEPELVFLSTALEIQHKTGGSMNRILEATRQSLVDEIELKRTLRTQTAQAKLSAQIVTAMPFALIGLFSLVSPGFLDPFFESAPGVILLVAALGMQVAGISIVRRLLKVGIV